MTFKYPIVVCPGCRTIMRPIKTEDATASRRLVEITYACKKCGTATKRAIKADDRKPRRQVRG